MDTQTAPRELASPSPWIWEGIDFRNLAWVVLALGVMVVAIQLDGYDWPLRFVHVASGVLLTGADIIMGFLIGPTLRKLDFEARRKFSQNLLPKTLFIFTPLGIIAPTSGYYYAERLGYMNLDYPEFYWIIGALVVSAILAIQGLGILLPTNLRAYLETRKAKPDAAKITRMMRLYFVTTASQGVMQVLIVTIMVKMAGGGL
jgi:tellurite resistance protein TehA-like permease